MTPIPNPITYHEVKDYPQPADPPFLPLGVKYYELSVQIREVSATENRLEFFIQNSGFFPDMKKYSDVEAFAKQVAMKGHPIARLAKADVALARAVPSRLDLTVDRQCYLVIHLDETFNWVFQDDFMPLSFKNDYDVDDMGAEKIRNFDLRKVDDKGNVLKWRETKNNKTRTLFMSIHQRDYDEVESFNLHVEFMEGPYTLKTIFDPDIKNDGGAPFPP